MADRQDRSLTARPFDDSLPPANNALWGAACFPFIVTNCRRREINENPLCTQKYPAPYKNRGLIIVRPMMIISQLAVAFVVAWLYYMLAMVMTTYDGILSMILQPIM